MADVRYPADFVRYTPRSRRSGQGWECLKLTQLGHRAVPEFQQGDIEFEGLGTSVTTGLHVR